MKTDKSSRHFEGSIPEMSLIDGRFKVEWVRLGEGRDGDYNDSDKNDVEFLRFDVSFDGNVLQDGSYCTLIPVHTEENVLKTGLEMIMDRVKDNCQDGDCPKKVLEELSWIGPKWFSKT